MKRVVSPDLSAHQDAIDVHGTPAQRFYNLLCIAYGADAQLFGDRGLTRNSATAAR
jgi:hypothetical protein